MQGSLNNFALGNGNGNGMPGLGTATGPNNASIGFGSMDMDKTSTQVTIPKDVSLIFFQVFNSLFLNLFIIVFLKSWLEPSLARAEVEFVVFVPSRMRSFKLMKHFLDRPIES
jgi:hypothetical protein